MEQQVTGSGYEVAPRRDDHPVTAPIRRAAIVPAPRSAYGPVPPPAHPSFPPVPVAAPMPWPPPVSPAPPAGPSGALRALVVVALTVVVLAVLALAGLLLYPRLAATPAPAPVVAAPSTVVVPASPAAGSSGSTTTSGAYSCGSANGYAITVNNGNVPCTSARWVTTMWTTDGTTPMSGTGPAGTPYSWTCSSSGSAADEVGSCVSKMGSTFTISR